MEQLEAKKSIHESIKNSATPMESEDQIAETRAQLTKTKTQYEQLLVSGKIKDQRRITSFK